MSMGSGARSGRRRRLVACVLAAATGCTTGAVEALRVPVVAERLLGAAIDDERGTTVDLLLSTGERRRYRFPYGPIVAAQRVDAAAPLQGSAWPVAAVAAAQPMHGDEPAWVPPEVRGDDGAWRIWIEHSESSDGWNRRPVERIRVQPPRDAMRCNAVLGDLRTTDWTAPRSWVWAALTPAALLLDVATFPLQLVVPGPAPTFARWQEWWGG